MILRLLEGITIRFRSRRRRGREHRGHRRRWTWRWRLKRERGGEGKVIFGAGWRSFWPSSSWNPKIHISDFWQTTNTCILCGCSWHSDNTSSHQI